MISPRAVNYGQFNQREQVPGRNFKGRDLSSSLYYHLPYHTEPTPNSLKFVYLYIKCGLLGCPQQNFAK